MNSEVGRREQGFTLIELATSLALISTVLVAIFGAYLGIQEAFAENQTQTSVRMRSRAAMERIVQLASQANTTDAEFASLGSDEGLGFRLTTNFVDGDPVYDDTLHCFIYGPSASPNCEGVVVGRGSSLLALHSAVAGDDSILGTVDDNTSAISNGTRQLELLLDERYQPSTAPMLQVVIDADARLVTFTLRTNFRDGEGGFLLGEDIVLTERVALMR